MNYAPINPKASGVVSAAEMARAVELVEGNKLKPSDAARQERDAHLRRAREEEMRREDEVVVKLLAEERRILVLSHTHQQFKMFREKLERARDALALGRPGIVYVNRSHGQDLWGHSSRSAVLVLLDSWELTTDDSVLRLVWHLERDRGFEVLST
jgi:hypothetical protein